MKLVKSYSSLGIAVVGQPTSSCILEHGSESEEPLIRWYKLDSIGGFLHIYKLSNSTLMIKKEKIFDGQKIYGIKPNSSLSKIIIYGGKYITILHFNIEDMVLTIAGKNHILADWILDAKWIENDSKIVSAFMHNKITVWSEHFTPDISTKCEERCILYSAHIVYDNYKQLMIMSGTVFSEILLWKPFCMNENGLSPVLKRLSHHKGVIFSIHYNLQNSLICTASDDRSAVLWKVSNTDLLQDLNPSNSESLEVDIRHQVYGHLSRVFRCLVLEDAFVTAGEDSLLIIWSLEGALLRKIDAHQGGAVWSLCYDSSKDIICSGGNDGGISVYKMNPKITTDIISLLMSDNPKTIGIFKSGSMLCLSEKAILYYKSSSSESWERIAWLSDLEKYSLLQVSPCKKLAAFAGYYGQIYIYQETNNKIQLHCKYSLKCKTRIFSFHWIDCKTFLVSQKDGRIHLNMMWKNNIHYLQTFILPPVKESWPTCAYALNGHIIIGDRKGSIHNFKIGTSNPINSIKKAHSYLGVTKIYVDDDNMVTSLGRDGFLKRFILVDGYLKYMDSNKSKTSWLIAKENKYLLSFSGENFVITDFKFQRVLFATQCGGGHRSWQYLINNENITFSYIKQKKIHTIKLNLEHLTPKNKTEGYHVKEINALEVLRVGNKHIIVSGGEDTVLRLSTFHNDKQLIVLEYFKVHLSSIRAICIYPFPKSSNNEYLLFTAGGRAQIICWHLSVHVNKLAPLKVSCSEKFNFYEPLDQNEAETRVMDLTVGSSNEKIFLFAGYSDGYIKVFTVAENMSLEPRKTILHSHHSVTKLIKINSQSIGLLGTMATDGYLAFWSLDGLFYNTEELQAMSSFKIHQSGIKSCSYTVQDGRIVFLSGGDDNCIKLTIFAFCTKTKSIVKINSFEDQMVHCAQITGAYLGVNYFVTSSIDQRILIHFWTLVDDKVVSKIINKYDTAIADPQGLAVLPNDNNLMICVYGNGIEYLQIDLQKLVLA